MPDQLPEALHLLEECARRLMATGGMLNKDLARDVTRFVARAKDVSTAPAVYNMPAAAYDMTASRSLVAPTTTTQG